MTWHFLKSPAGSAAANMALDDVLLRTAAQRSRPLLRVYSWLRPAVSIGYFQKFPDHLSSRYEIVRRPTGGGLVYHVDDTTFTLVAPPGHALHKLTTAEAYSAIHKTVATVLDAALHEAALKSPGGQYECFEQPVAGDVVRAGRKLAGGAQRRNRDGLLHQGSIAAHVTAEQLADGFAKQFDIRIESYQLTGEEQMMATWLTDGKYRSDAWNRRIV